MTKKEEIQQEIEKTQKQLAALQDKLKEAEDEVPETLVFAENDEYCYVDDVGNIYWRVLHRPTSSIDAGRVRKRRAFLSEEYAEAFAKKTQFIADMLHFKYLYDRDYKPDWDSVDKNKFYVCYNNKTKRFKWGYSTSYSRMIESVYFSTEQLAEKCADWLNKKYNLEEDKNDG